MCGDFGGSNGAAKWESVMFFYDATACRLYRKKGGRFGSAASSQYVIFTSRQST